MKPALLLTTLAASCSPGLGPVVPGTEVERKMIALLEKFDRWDDNGDGQLDRSELADGLKGTDHSPDRVIAFYDTDRNTSSAGYSTATTSWPNTAVSPARSARRRPATAAPARPRK